MTVCRRRLLDCILCTPLWCKTCYRNKRGSLIIKGLLNTHLRSSNTVFSLPCAVLRHMPVWKGRCRRWERDRLGGGEALRCFTWAAAILSSSVAQVGSNNLWGRGGATVNFNIHFYFWHICYKLWDGVLIPTGLETGRIILCCFVLFSSILLLEGPPGRWPKSLLSHQTS